MTKINLLHIFVGTCEDCLNWSRPTATEACYMTGGCIGWCGRADMGPIKNLQMGPKDSCSRWVWKQKQIHIPTGFGIDPL